VSGGRPRDLIEDTPGITPNRKAAPMTTKYYHTPPLTNATRVRCPVCHEAVYSRAGIHPQCAARQAEPPRPKAKPPQPPGQADSVPRAPEKAGASKVDP